MNLKEVKADTWARLIFSVVSLVNIVLGLFGYTELDIDENTMYTIISITALITSTIRGFWKNNSFTEKAQQADKVLNEEEANG